MATPTTPRCDDAYVNMGSSTTIYTPRASSGYTHKLTYTFLNASGTIGTDVGLSKKWDVPIELAEQIPKATTAKATVTCKTYDSKGKLIGTKSIQVKLDVPQRIKPVVSVQARDLNTQVAEAFGGRWVAGLSEVEVEVTASGMYGAKITDYHITVWTNGQSKHFDVASKKATFPVEDWGAVEIWGSAGDSRGRSEDSLDDVSNEVMLYDPPKVTSLTMQKLNEEGTTVEVTISGSYSPMQVGVEIRNTQSLVLKYKKSSDIDYTPISIDLSGKGESWTVSKTITGITPDVTYEYKAELTDKIQTTAKTLKSGIVAISRLAGGKGIRFFKEAEKEGFWVEDVDYTISTEDFNAISDNLGGIPDMSLANALKKMTEAVDVPLTWKSGWGGTYMCKAYPAQRICRLTGTVETGHPVLKPSTYVIVADIPSAYLPTEVYALTASGGTQIVEGTVGSLGVRLRAKGGDWTAGYLGYFSGWWYY